MTEGVYTPADSNYWMLARAVCSNILPRRAAAAKTVEVWLCYFAPGADNRLTSSE